MEVSGTRSNISTICNAFLISLYFSLFLFLFTSIHFTEANKHCEVGLDRLLSGIKGQVFTLPTLFSLLSSINLLMLCMEMWNREKFLSLSTSHNHIIIVIIIKHIGEISRSTIDAPSPIFTTFVRTEMNINFYYLPISTTTTTVSTSTQMWEVCCVVLWSSLLSIS